MKTFEERYTAWLDGKLIGAEQESFERELGDREAADEDRREFEKCRNLLRNAVAPTLRNEDFFTHQLMARIEAERSPAAPERVRAWFSMPWLRIATAGFAVLVIGWMLGTTMNLGRRDRLAATDETSSGIARIISAQALDAGIYASVLQDDQEDVAVVWLDGLDYLPASYQLQ